MTKQEQQVFEQASKYIDDNNIESFEVFHKYLQKENEEMYEYLRDHVEVLNKVFDKIIEKQSK